MKYRQLGHTSLTVSNLCYGTWQFGGDWGSFEVREAQAAIRHALELGITFFDTAQAYGFGKSESVLGQALQPELKSRRDKIVIATKGGLRMEGNKLLRDASAGWLRRGVEQSLRNLGVHYIDLYQVHWIEQEILPYCQSHGIGVLVYGPLAHGLLGGRYTPKTNFANDDWRSKSPAFRAELFARNLAVVGRLKGLAERQRMTLAQLAIAWVLANPAVDVAIIGARHPKQLTDTTAAADVELSDETRREIEMIMKDAVPTGGPSPEAM